MPAVNIGNRQKNRLAAASVLHSGYDAASIHAAMEKALSPHFRAFAATVVNPYDPHRDGQNSRRIIHALEKALADFGRDRLLKKGFSTSVRPEAWNSLLK